MGIFDEKLSLKPDHYTWTADFIHSAWQSHWTPEEFNFTKDYSDFKTVLTKEEQDIVKRALSAISQVEISVKTFWAQLYKNLPHPSISDLGFTLANQEVIHQRAYTKLLEVLNLEEAFEELLQEPVMQGRVQYLRKYNQKLYTVDERKQYVYQLCLFTLFVENVSLFSQFFIILWLNRRNGALKDTAQQINYTMLEENLHSKVGIKLINTIREEYPELFDQELEDRITEECELAIEYEKNVLRWILGDYHQEGLNQEILEAFISKRMISCMNDIGINHNISYNRDRDAEIRWVDEMLLSQNFVDFFVKKPVDYQKNVIVSEDDLF